MIILDTPNFIDTRIGAIAELLQDHEVSELSVLLAVLHLIRLTKARVAGPSLTLNRCLETATTDRRVVELMWIHVIILFILYY